MNFVNSYILITFVFAIFNFADTKEFRFIIGILLLAIINEALSFFLISKNVSYSLTTTIYLLVHNLLWLYFFPLLTNKIAIAGLLISYLCFATVNLFFLEGFSEFNHNTFILGALLYVIIFISRSFIELKNEQLDFFTKNRYLLYSSPVLFFIGVSFVFGFKSEVLADTIIIGNMTLYEAIITFVNFIYYSLINLYIYKEKRLLDA